MQGGLVKNSTPQDRVLSVRFSLEAVKCPQRCLAQPAANPKFVDHVYALNRRPKEGELASPESGEPHDTNHWRAVGLTVRSDSTDGPVAPAVRRGIVSRRELFERLEEAGRVVNLSAPAGSGKTILLRSWIEEAGLAERAAWVAVGPERRDPQRFWISVSDALRGTTPGSKVVQALTAAPDLDGWAIVEHLLADLGRLRERISALPPKSHG